MCVTTQIAASVQQARFAIILEASRLSMRHQRSTVNTDQPAITDGCATCSDSSGDVQGRLQISPTERKLPHAAICSVHAVLP